MTHQNTKKCIHILPDIIESYDNIPHQGLGASQTLNQIHNLNDPNII